MKCFKSALFILVLFSLVHMNVNAEDKFDADFYGKSYPDVVREYGTDEADLYYHYCKFGKYEGRLAYAEDDPYVGVPIVQHGNISEDVLITISSQLSLIPLSIKSKFNADGWCLLATDENIAKTEFSGEYDLLRGVTNFADNYIKIDNRVAAAQTATVHEFGHYLYYICNRFENNDEVINVFNEEKNNIGKAVSSGNGLDNCREFYAEVFYLYCNYRKLAMAKYPKMLSIIEDDIASIG